MDAGYAAEYESLYRSHWWWRARERFVEDEIARRSPPSGFGPMLDVGCGNGLLFPVLARYGQPEGIEPDASILTSSGEAHGRIVCAPFDETFQPERRYGLVLLLDVLEHLANPVEALDRARRLLLPGGAVVVTVPALRVLWTSHDDRNHHLRRYTRRELETSARQASLRVVAHRYWFGWLVPVKLLVRVKEAVLGSSPRLHRTPPPWLNRCFWRLALLEHRLLGSALPAGTSLFYWLEAERRGLPAAAKSSAAPTVTRWARRPSTPAGSATRE